MCFKKLRREAQAEAQAASASREAKSLLNLRIRGIEPISPAWKADNLPLIYIRALSFQAFFSNRIVFHFTDGEGFEPPVSKIDTSVFKTDTFNHSDIHPHLTLAARF